MTNDFNFTCKGEKQIFLGGGYLYLICLWSIYTGIRDCFATYFCTIKFIQLFKIKIMHQNQLIGGARILSAEEAEQVDLGSLTELMGTWISAAIPPEKIAQGWNVISIPGPSGFMYEVIPYTEILTFKPVIAALNKGPIIKGEEVIQEITGLMYEQQIFSACPPDKPCNPQFPAGAQIHAETGFLLNFKQKANPNNPSGGFDFARLATIPHGNSVLALGHASTEQATTGEPIGNSFFPKASAQPTSIDGSGPRGQGIVPIGYDNIITFPLQFPGVFNDQANPNSFLKDALGDQKIIAMTILQMSTNNINAGGGILNIPFIDSNAKATSMDAIFWIETIEGNNQLQLQYTQTINLVFQPTGSSTSIVWPHITVNTLTKVS
ncbi:MAG: hypothetical protein H7246_20400 [Phycisphaerae bacterium]|nr:hypothetical protein [Saprospiraceae bacterium]